MSSFISLESLWRQVKELQRQEPYCYSSERYAHRDAADDVAKAEKLEGDVLKQWRQFVNEKTARMSNYAGD